MPWDQPKLTVLDYVNAVDIIERRIAESEKAERERARG